MGSGVVDIALRNLLARLEMDVLLVLDVCNGRYSMLVIHEIDYNLIQ